MTPTSITDARRDLGMGHIDEQTVEAVLSSIVRKTPATLRDSAADFQDRVATQLLAHFGRRRIG